jgi:hypothetical protein
MVERFAGKVIGRAQRLNRRSQRHQRITLNEYEPDRHRPFGVHDLLQDNPQDKLSRLGQTGQ